ncbi:helix-turn-helix domain-containing protein [Bradyrhizobium sp.]|uniref:helix-turn-helix domain-containing protein n=1 Tax=Bradyrhizobium sp. TaxID=376 RepID=UPI002DFCCF87|nr:helix-turn-helix domain-containing protein [Bradyrhizobium sp.]
MRKLAPAAQEERRRQVIGLRQNGVSYAAIAAQVGLSQTWVRGHGAHALNPRAKSVAYRRRIPGVCLGRGRGLRRLGHRHQLLRC